jgi:hypothetical protein
MEVPVKPKLLGIAALLAVAASCVACTSNVSGRASSRTSTGVTAPSTSSASASPSSSPSSSKSGGGASPGWSAHVNFASLSHPDLNCAAARLGGKVDILKVVTADLTGDGLPEAVVRMECAHSASEWPDTVDVYSDSSGTPTMIGSLLSQHDASYAPAITTQGATVTLGLTTWSKYAPGCCPDLNYTRTFTWTGHGFSAGALVDRVRACGDTAFDVSAGSEQGATGHSSVVLRFRNRLPQTCTVQGYPGLDAVTSTGAVLAHATRTLNGFAGGTHSITAITVAPGQTVSALVEWMNFNPVTSGSCPTSATIMVTPANTTATASLPVQVTSCVLQVHPTVAGTSGDG